MGDTNPFLHNSIYVFNFFSLLFLFFTAKITLFNHMDKFFL